MVILIISLCAIFVITIKSILNPIKGSGEFIQLTRLESETNQSKKIFSTIITIIIITIIIIITRPKPAYGRQGLAGSWGQDTDEVSTFLVFLTSHFAPAALSSDLTNLGPLMTMKIHLETLKNHGNQPKTMKNHETTLKNHGNQAKTMKPP